MSNAIIKVELESFKKREDHFGLGYFHSTELNSAEQELLLSRIVFLSLKKGEWLLEFTANDICQSFKDLKPPVQLNMYSVEAFEYHLWQLINKGYFEKPGSASEELHYGDTLKPTDKFFVFCSKY
jgi:hypothetical protein